MERQSSVSFQAGIRNNAEEINCVLKDFSTWADEMKEYDVCIRRDSNDVDTETKNQMIDSKNHVFESDECSKNGTRRTDPGEEASDEPNFIETDPIKKSMEQLVDEERSRGNGLYSSGKFSEAIKSYTRCLQLNPKCALAYSNRAMAHIKIKEWRNAESDACMALAIDAYNTKSYQRRSTARLSLGKIRLALKDLYLADGKQSKDDETKPLDKKKIEKALMLAIRRAPKKEVSITMKLSDETSSGINIDEHPSFPAEIATKKNTELSRVKTWYDFELAWKVLQPSEKTQYLKKIKPEKLTDLYKNGMEDTDLLDDLLYHISRLRDNSGRYLKAVSAIPSLDMLVMMMSSKQRERIKMNIDHIICTTAVSGKERSYIRNAFSIS